MTRPAEGEVSAGPVPGEGAGTAGCPACGGADLLQSVAFDAVPVLCNSLLHDRESALSAARGRFVLSYCRECCHLFNSAFDSARIGYTQSYENSLHFSPRFAEFDLALARRLGSAYRLAGKLVVDVGCGKGDFLKRICLETGAEGIGFDKSFEKDRGERVANVEFVNAWFDAASRPEIRPALVTLRHVLEHIADPAPFLESLGAHPGIDRETVFYIEVPNALYTLRDMGIWDLIYEHVSYFTPRSLRTLLSGSGFEILEEGACFGGQYLFVEARAKGPARGAASGRSAEMERLVKGFDSACRAKLGEWRGVLARRERSRTVVWGAGSKGITFVNLVPEAAEVAALVDINPHKQGRFAPGTGTPVISAAQLPPRKPEAIVVMNPLYRAEIEGMAREMGLSAEVLAG